MVWGPTAVGVSLTVQLVLTATVRELVVAPSMVHLATALLVSSLSLHDALPISVAEIGVLSVTIAVQLLGLPTGTLAGVQLTAVLVSCLRAVTTTVPELLRWLASPL